MQAASWAAPPLRACGQWQDGGDGSRPVSSANGLYLGPASSKDNESVATNRAKQRQPSRHFGDWLAVDRGFGSLVDQEPARVEHRARAATGDAVRVVHDDHDVIGADLEG